MIGRSGRHLPAPILKAKLPGSIICVVVLLVIGCASYPGTGSLWVGMTRAQALRAMGPPESVSAQGGFEYLNYTLPVRGGGYVVGRPYSIRLVDNTVESFGYSGQFTAGVGAPSAARSSAMSSPVAADSLYVVSVEPAKLAVSVINHVKIRLSYSLQSRPAAMISLSFNTKTPGTELTLATKNVPLGRGEIDLTAEVAPVDWPNRSDVKMLASLFPLPANGASSLAYLEWDLPVAR